VNCVLASVHGFAADCLVCLVIAYPKFITALGNLHIVQFFDFGLSRI
jgi:hypothetical protein